MSKRIELTVERLKTLLHYDPLTGAFTTLLTRGGHKPGPVAGQLMKKGYRRLSVDNRMYLMHRLAWLYMHGEWPTGLIDHDNGNKQDNRIANLRDCDTAQNGWNQGAQKTNTSGYKGVFASGTKWAAQIQVNGKKHYAGVFCTKEEAAHAYNKAAIHHHGEFAVLNPVSGVFCHG